jgi:hypothetical protein
MFWTTVDVWQLYIWHTGLAKPWVRRKQNVILCNWSLIDASIFNDFVPQFISKLYLNLEEKFIY